MPSAIAAPDLTLSMSAVVRSKRRKCTAAVFSSLLRGEIFVRNRVDRFAGADPDPHAMFDIDHLRERGAAFCDVLVLDHERRFPVVTVGDQRVVRGDLFGDAGGFEDAFDAQHFLDLIFHRHEVFEHQRRVRTERDTPRLLVFDDLGAKSGAPRRVFLQTPDRRAVEFRMHVRFRRRAARG